MGALADRLEKASALRNIVNRAGLGQAEELEKAADERAAKVKSALSKLRKQYPDGIPAKLRRQAFQDPDSILSADED